MIGHAGDRSAPNAGTRRARWGSIPPRPLYGLHLGGIAVGAMPFLLPMMFQIGFGLPAMQSGLITLISCVGSLLMRTCVPWLLKLLGFRTVLIWVGLPATCLLAMSMAFGPWWPLLLI
jgi:Na+/melibiose symporter-like transporter